MSDEMLEMDRAAGPAWREFQALLGDRLAAMAEDDILLVETLTGRQPQHGTTPYVQFCRWDGGMLRGEVSSDHVLDGPWQIGQDGARALGALGYDAPTYGPGDEADGGSLNHYADLPATQGDRLAVMAVRALRDVFGVVHPALLCSPDLDRTPAAREPAALDRMDEPPATFPHGGHEQLVELVDRALVPYFGQLPQHDDDGDIPVRAGRTVIFVRVQESVPVVELFCCVATDVTDRERALFEVNALNREERFVKYRLVDDSILVDVQLPGWPFVPEHLRSMLALLTETVERVEGDLVFRVGGRTLYDDPDVEVVDHPGADDRGGDGPGAAAEAVEADADGTDAVQTVEGLRVLPADRAVELLGELEAESAGSVSPELAASVCGYDATRLLDLIRQEERERLEWRKLRDQIAGAHDHAEIGCEHEIAYSDRMISLLRRALRVVVERRAAQDEVALPALAVPPVERRRSPHDRPSRRPGPRRVPDPTIEEVDPEIWG